MTISTIYLSPTQFEQFIPDLIESTWLTIEPGILIPATLFTCIEYEAKKSEISEAKIKNILNLLQSPKNNFLQSRCFLDRLTGLWRYEFGKLIICKNTGKELRGDFTWPPVEILLKSLFTAFRLMDEKKFVSYIKKLVHPSNHREALAEMWPLLRIDHQTIHVEFDVERYSPPKENGKPKNIDLLVKYQQRTVLVEVKARTFYLLKLTDRDDSEATPGHKTSQLFKGVEDKFCEAKSDERLQGVWINIYVQQSYNKLIKEFNELNKNKIHFVILGGETENAFILTRKEEDRKLLLNLFKLNESNRFIF